MWPKNVITQILQSLNNSIFHSSYVAYYGLRNHLRVSHNGDRVNKPYKCEFCEFSSHADKYLKAHILNCHQKEKHNHNCDICQKKFAYPHLLSEHKETVHEGIKRFMCDKCGKSFAKRLKTLFDEHVTKCDRTKGMLFSNYGHVIYFIRLNFY